MDWKVDKKFQRLINEGIPRVPLRVLGSGEVSLCECGEQLPIPEAGFIAHYCRK